MTIAFDVDGTLIYEDAPRHEIINLFRGFYGLGCEMIIWSGGGIEYAERWADRLGLNAIIAAKGSLRPDLTFDDEEITLGICNYQVPRGEICKIAQDDFINTLLTFPNWDI